jgi:hypothetical protein
MLKKLFSTGVQKNVELETSIIMVSIATHYMGTSIFGVGPEMAEVLTYETLSRPTIQGYFFSQKENSNHNEL